MFEKIIKEKLDKKEIKIEFKKMFIKHDERVNMLRKLKNI